MSIGNIKANKLKMTIIRSILTTGAGTGAGTIAGYISYNAIYDIFGLEHYWLDKEIFKWIGGIIGYSVGFYLSIDL